MKVGALDPDKLVPYAAGAGALVVLGVVLFVYAKGWKGAAASTTRAAAQAAGGAVSGVVLGVGDVLGVPDPATPENQAKCKAALAAGDHGAIALYCPAGTFVKSLFAWGANPPALVPPMSDSLILPTVGDLPLGPVESAVPMPAKNPLFDEPPLI